MLAGLLVGSAVLDPGNAAMTAVNGDTILLVYCVVRMKMGASLANWCVHNNHLQVHFTQSLSKCQYSEIEYAIIHAD